MLETPTRSPAPILSRRVLRLVDKSIMLTSRLA
jgi:hypothetical protein